MRGGAALPHAVLGVAVLAATLVGACADRAEPRFPHRAHLAELDCGAPGKPYCLDCNSCHAVSKSDRAHKLPAAATCARCHGGDTRKVLAVFETKPERASGALRFDHDRHLAMPTVQGQCVPCHAGVVEPRRSTLPPMSQCLSCHEHEEQFRAGVCVPCHVQADMERTVPQTFLRHDQGFVRRHGQLALQEKRVCGSCHAEAQCDGCHDVSQDVGIERRRPDRIEEEFVHRRDFMVRHSIEAEAQPARCARCHTVDTCDSCHVARGVSGNRAGSRSPHPPGWVGTNAGSKSFHGREARRDIVSCASCHEQGPATNCIRCHKVGGFGGNPHPRGWKSGGSESSGMCGYCHG